MGFLTALFAPQFRAGVPGAGDDFWYGPAYGPTWSGADVTPASAMRIAAVWACVNFIARNLAALPKHVYSRMEDGGKQREPEHPVYGLIHGQPNDLQTAYEFWFMLVSHAVLRGNGYALKVRGGRRGEVRQLLPQHPDAVTVEVLRSGAVRYRIRQRGGGEAVHGPDDMLHIRPFTDNGITGQSVIDVHRNTFGEALGAQEHAARFWANAATPQGVLTTEQSFKTPEDRAKTLASLDAATTGINKHKLLVLERGFKFDPIAMTQRDAQFIESRQFTRGDIASIFGLPPHVIGDLTRSTNNNIEEQGIELVIYTLTAWAVLIEQAIDRDLILDTDRYFAKLLLDGLMRGNTLARYQAHSLAVTNGWKNRNEIRVTEDLNPVHGLDEFTRPLNAGLVGQDTGSAPEPGRPADDAGAPAAPNEDDDEPAPARRKSRKAAAAAGPGRLHIVVRSLAAAIVRKEAVAVGNIAKRHVDDTAGWLAEVETFYAQHAARIAQTLELPPAAVAGYIQGQLAALRERGLAATETWEAEVVPRLAELAINGGN